MPNMSYCRFSNTLGDLQDCYDHMDDEIKNEAEQRARKRLIKLARSIANDYGDEVE